MKLTSIISALPASQNTGWGVAGRRITEELTKIALVHDLRNHDALKSDFPVLFNAPVLQGMQGVNLLPVYGNLFSDKRVGYSFCEDSLLQRKYGDNGKRHWTAAVCGSTWGRVNMRIAVNDEIPVLLAIQGVDQDIFKPLENPESSHAEKFTIWSSGKFEYRKAQDVVIRAVGIMMDRHKDVFLKAAWWNPWPTSMATMVQSKLIKFTGDMISCCYDYLYMNRVEFIGGNEPHGESVKNINSCDIGLFPNRCEAGTNLPLMEAMSCGLPVIATVEHGHKDLARGIGGGAIPSRVFTVERGGMAVAEWFEPEFDATVEALESMYQAWRSRQSLHLYTGREFISQFTWASCAQKLLEACQI